MCLRTECKNPFIANKEIICYKIMYYDSTEHQWVSFCQIERFPFGNLKAKGSKCIQSNPILFYKISSGYFHAYTTFPKADLEHSLIDDNFIVLSLPIVIVKCIIPKGSMYYLSGDGMEICADRMIILEENIL